MRTPTATKQPAPSKKTVGVLFGGRSVEHEISVITALQLMDALDVERYTIVPIYISTQGRWYTGEALRDRQFYRSLPQSFTSLVEVTLLPIAGNSTLTVIREPVKAKLKRWIRGAPLPASIDVFIPAFHGEYGEDGCMQGLLELLGVPYTGCDVTASAIAMNKYLCKSTLSAHGIAVLPGAIIRKRDALQHFEKSLSNLHAMPGLEQFPLFVKPCHLGSSIGVSRVESTQALHAALAKVFTHDSEALVEPFLANMMEINVSVIGGTSSRASVVEVPVTDNEFLSYEEKYMREGSKKTGESSDRSEGMASLTRAINPANLGADIKSAAIETALYAYEILGCTGVVRFDFMYDKENGKLYFNELNPFPGSLSFYLWEKSNPPLLYTDELNMVIDEALKRHELATSLEKHVGFKAL